MRMICTLMLLAVLPATRASDCPANLRWQDGTYAERTTIRQGVQVRAAVKQFVEGPTVVFDMMGEKAGMLTLAWGGDDDKISFLKAPENFRPSQFAEVGMAVDVPFGTDPNFAGPCALEDKVTVQVSDVVGRLANKSNLEKSGRLKGWMRRNGLSVEYSLQESPDVEMHGSWQYDRQPPNFPFNTDVQGWRVFRRDTLLMALPVGKPLHLSAALEQLRGATQ